LAAARSSCTVLEKMQPIASPNFSVVWTVSRF
jgi:hypothetical protein